MQIKNEDLVCFDTAIHLAFIGQMGCMCPINCNS